MSSQSCRNPASQRFIPWLFVTLGERKNRQSEKMGETGIIIPDCDEHDSILMMSIESKTSSLEILLDNMWTVCVKKGKDVCKRKEFDSEAMCLSCDNVLVFWCIAERWLRIPWRENGWVKYFKWLHVCSIAAKVQVSPLILNERNSFTR